MSVPISSSAVIASTAAAKNKSGGFRDRQWKIKGGRSGIPDAADMRSVDVYIASMKKDATLSSQDLVAKLHETLSLEGKYQPCINLPKKPQHVSLTDIYKYIYIFYQLLQSRIIN